MTLATFTINGTPLESLGLGLVKPTGASGWQDHPALERRLVQLPEVPGSVDLGDTPRYAPRVIPLRLLASPTTLAERTAILDDLAQRFAGPVEIVSVQDATRVTVGRLEALEATTIGPAFMTSQPVMQAAFNLVCDDPCWYDLTPTLVSLPASGTQATLPAGTMATRRLVVTIAGACTNPVLILRDFRGEELQRMTLTITLLATDFLTVDMEAMTITKTASGTESDQRSVLAASEGYLRVPPIATTLALSVASGTVAGSARLTRAYRN